MTSNEYREAVVKHFFSQYFGRSQVNLAFDQGVAFWARELRTGLVRPPVPVTILGTTPLNPQPAADGPLTDEQVQAMLLASNEYFLREHQYP